MGFGCGCAGSRVDAVTRETEFAAAAGACGTGRDDRGRDLPSIGRGLERHGLFSDGYRWGGSPGGGSLGPQSTCVAAVAFAWLAGFCDGATAGIVGWIA